eukprot:TRINITY_DN26547_c0_g1_i2.p1 TRINITY_DN26547_c0_g1~~TRINITY_DN26547_c0_g1_i2.p1  ORF type:complete len:100 (-),score=1.49 TRINITY_DN26547_c0_g1_i2:889-1188(-)
MIRKWSFEITFVFLLKFSLSNDVVASLNLSKAPKSYFSFHPPYRFPPSGDFVDSFFLNSLQHGLRGCFSTCFGLKHHIFKHHIMLRYSFCCLPIVCFSK